MKKKYFLKFVLVWLLIFSWVFSGWPKIWNGSKVLFEVENAKAGTSSSHASAYTLTTGFDFNFSNPEKAYSSNNDYALADDSKPRNKEFATNWRGFNFSGIPSGSTINSVTIHIEEKMGSSNLVGQWRASLWQDVTLSAALAPGTSGALDGGTQHTRATTDISDTDWTFSLTTLPTLAQLQASNFGIRVQYAQGNDGKLYKGYVDDIYIVVDYTIPNTSPTVVSNTADSNDFGGDTTPTLEFTGDDAQGDDIRYNIQIDSTSTFNSQGGGYMDSYEESNYDSFYELSNSSDGITGIGQSFTGDGTDIESVSLFIKKGTNSCPNIYVKIYAHNGTFGSTSVPASSVLATSDGVSWASLTTSFQLVKFTFSTPYTTTNGTKYVLTINSSNNDSIILGYDNSTPSHPGNFCRYYFVPENWSSVSGSDLIFYINEGLPILNKFSNIDAGFSNVDTPSDTNPFNSGDKCDYTVQSGEAFSSGTYYWRVRGIDPNGSNIYGNWTTARNFTITEAAVSISITANDIIDYGTIISSKDTTLNGINSTIQIQNTGEVAADFDIKGQNSSDWILGASAGDAIYSHKWCSSDCDSNPVWNPLTTTYDGNYLFSNVLTNETVGFDLQVTVPTSNSGVDQQNVDVFIQASQH